MEVKKISESLKERWIAEYLKDLFKLFQKKKLEWSHHKDRKELTFLIKNKQIIFHYDSIEIFNQ